MSDIPDNSPLEAREEILNAPVRPVTKKILVKLLFYVSPEGELEAKFGADIAAYHWALFESIYMIDAQKSVTQIAKEFDRTLGNGEKHTALVEKFAPGTTFSGVNKAPEQAPVRPLTRQALERIVLDLPLSNVVCDDFGVESAAHYRALRECICVAIEEKSIDEVAEELDQALGNGKKLTALVKKYAPDYAVTFHTIWDDLTW